MSYIPLLSTEFLHPSSLCLNKVSQPIALAMAESRMLTVAMKNEVINDNLEKLKDLIEELDQVLENQDELLSQKHELASDYTSKRDTAKLLKNCHRLDLALVCFQTKVAEMQNLSQYIQRNLILHSFSQN